MLKWWIAAERGSEIAQNNLAYVLDQDRSVLRLTCFSPIIPSNDTARLALTQWTRAAAQRNIDALVKVGDYYFHGLGIPSESSTSPSSTSSSSALSADERAARAAAYYQSAADTQLSALAMWNLGWMYENGVGVSQASFLLLTFNWVKLTSPRTFISQRGFTIWPLRQMSKLIFPLSCLS